MPHPDERQLLATLPPAIRTPLTFALDNAPPNLAAAYRERAYRDALSAANDAREAAGFDSEGGLPLASELTDEQRTLATILAYRDEFELNLWYIPRQAYWRRRWLGLEPPGVLEREVSAEVEGKTVTLPLWKVIEQREHKDVLSRHGLSLRERLEVMWGIWCDAYCLGFDNDTLPWGSLNDIKGQPELGAWATRCVEAVAAAVASGINHKEYVFRGGAFREWAWPVFWALHQAKVPIVPEWDALLPMFDSPPPKQMFALLESLPEARRAAAIVGTLHPSGVKRILGGLAMLKRFPTRELAEFLLTELPKTDFSPSVFRREMAAVANQHPVVAEVLTATHKPRLSLQVTQVRRPTTLQELSPLEQKQIEIAGKAYDGEQLPAATRMSAERQHDDVSFRGSLVVRELADAKGEARFTVMLYGVDAGSVFRVGTTDEVAGVAQDSLECDDPALREALLDVLFADPPAAKPSAAKKNGTPAKKAPAKKATPAKKARAAKKAPAKKATPAKKKTLNALPSTGWRLLPAPAVNQRDCSKRTLSTRQPNLVELRDVLALVPA